MTPPGAAPGRLHDPRRRRAALLLVLTALTLLAAVTPRVNAPFRRLANYSADSGDPITTAAVDVAAVRSARALLPPGSRYAIRIGPEAETPQLYADLLGVALLYLAPSLPVNEPGDATWVLSYRAGGSLPEGRTAVRSYDLGGDVYLIEVE